MTPKRKQPTIAPVAKPAANMQVVDTRKGPPGTQLKDPVLSRSQQMKREMLMRNPAAAAKENAAAETKRTTGVLPKGLPPSTSAPSTGRKVGDVISGAEAKALGLGMAKGGAVKKKPAAKKTVAKKTVAKKAVVKKKK